MKKISPDEILALADYERVRNRLRPLFIHEKERRRLHVGSHLTFIFENAQTEWYQIEEMIRSEKMTDREAIQHEGSRGAGCDAADRVCRFAGTRRCVGASGWARAPSMAENW